ncbi:MAG: hypothetical protein QNJ97_28115 [Myxococcota bacterium]|nr:hypothetical protein [Myxococcota bacterium]
MNTKEKALNQKRSALIVLCFLCLVVGCSRSAKKETVKAQIVKPEEVQERQTMMSRIDMAQNKKLFFPEGIFNIHSKGKAPFGDEIKRKEYRRIYRIMEESSFFQNASEHVEMYRLLWQPSHSVITMIRLSRQRDRDILISKRLDKPGRSGVRIEETNEKNVSAEKFTQFLDLIKRSKYWDLPPTENKMMLDGEIFLLEGVKGGKYHLVERIGPGNSALHETCYFLLCLSGIEYGCQTPKW